ncbi:MAG TPA: class I SAM-dependent methyltransferase [Actinomycetota bacterium]|nr:class I SAM-dependent methyltransferase [Actinomycetota bacterium]
MFLRENEIGGKLAPHLEPGAEVLDLGAGTGRIAAWLARRVGIRPTLTDLVDYGNRVSDFPFIRIDDPLRVPADDGSFDVVVMLFVLHHMERWQDQERLVADAARVARRRVLVIEDTPASRVERWINVAWDWALNLRHGVPTPFTFRSTEGWREVFERVGMHVRVVETYRARWPSLMTYHHTLFVLEK